MNDELQDDAERESADVGIAPAADDYADEYTLNDIGLALRLRALAD